jgi:hypothetical protein
MMPQHTQDTAEHTQDRQNGQPATDNQTHDSYPDPAPVVEDPAVEEERAAVAQAVTSDPIVPVEAAERLRAQWHDAQGGFVDDPPMAVTATRSLLTEAAQLMTAGIEARSGRLHTTASTEDLRQELRRYRQLFDHLVTI